MVEEIEELDQEKREKIVIFATHGPEDPERTSLPFVVANAALAMDVEVTVMLQGIAVLIAQRGTADHVFAAGLPPLKDLMNSFLEQGGNLIVCTPCINERKIDKEGLIEGAVPVKAGRAVMEILEATNVLNY